MKLKDRILKGIEIIENSDQIHKYSNSCVVIEDGFELEWRDFDGKEKISVNYNAEVCYDMEQRKEWFGGLYVSLDDVLKATKRERVK